jgi:hypothetical protein
MSDSPETATQKPDREDNGQFAAGNRGGPGNPFAREVAELRKAILARLTVESASEIADTLIARAKGGDVAAARLLFQYALGKPAKAVEPDRVEVEEHHLRMESTVPMNEMAQPPGYISVENANDLSDIFRPLMDKEMMKPFLLGLDAVKDVKGPLTKEQKKAAIRATRRALRRINRGLSPSPNGSPDDPSELSIFDGLNGSDRRGGPHRAS